MTTIDPAARLAGTFDTSDLRSFVDGDGPFVTVLHPAPSGAFGSDHRFEVKWKHARQTMGEQWSAERQDELDQVVSELHHSDAASFVVAQRADGTTFVEPMVSELKGDDAVVTIGDAPRLLEIIDARQRMLPHVVVEADRTGATITGFDGGNVTDRDDVEGDTEHIHRGRGGGWSHRRFQQRAENTWERNAGEVAEAVTTMARDLDPVLVAVSGEVRAKQLLVADLGDEFGDRLVDIGAGDAEGIADEVVDALADRRARFQVAILERLRNEGGITDPDEVMQALGEGRVETLLIAGPSTRAEDSVRADQLDAIGRATTAALTTSAAVVVVPSTAEMSGGLAALARW
jgi:stalled ribosome rescue protein Dom34